MDMKIGFDNEKYLKEQSEEIRRRAGKYGRLYLEFGGKLINDFHALALGLVSEKELAEIYRLTGKINDVLVPIFKGIGITLVDFKVEFGRLPDGSIVLSDDITPDSARFWDIETGMKLDKDRFRHDNGKVGQGYNTVYERLKAELNG